ncbi:tRNA lysidine(34) synthetase TilS [Chelativorans sp. Marseille-P2723]|uniref:tRNA lysidine(34) synthetase TilS n=1 Tax=Chelativorans sp. Marseille-P2723 TaxID=2709133 RepID=UPI001FEE45EB|nr:tRNA lysidine(34) synthetase TilS [Chelativorans sp. Marseille-P2723]
MLSKDTLPKPDALFSAFSFAEHGTVVAAVSGGGDSLALLFLLHDYFRRLPRAPTLLAVTVDHGLRAQSAEEARMVARLADNHGIHHRTMRWEGRKPTSGISAAGREARFDLLARAAREAGASLVLTAHTADDQAETVAMRLTRGKGRGTAGIAPASLLEPGGQDVWFARPLLGVRREALRTFLKERGIEWIEDPTNRDRRFERARLRQGLDEKTIQELLVKGREAAQARVEAGCRAAERIESAAVKPAPGLIRITLSRLGTDGFSAYALRILLAVAGGTSHLPDEKRTAELLACAGAGYFRTSLSRAVATCKNGNLYLYREHRGLPSIELAPSMLWDGRYRIFTKGRLEGRIAPFGASTVSSEVMVEKDAPAGVVRAALFAEPTLWQGENCLGPPGLISGIASRPVAAPWSRLLPSFDLAPARAAMTLLGTSPLPQLPWRDHNDRIG